MFDTLCTLPLSSELFSHAIHPNEPVLAVGLSSGHVASLRLPAEPHEPGADDDDDDEDDEDSSSPNGLGYIDTAWRTRRHKGSCRSLAFAHDGTALFSAGTDGIVKTADAETGRVVSKIAVPLDPSTGEVDEPSLLHVLGPQTLLLATDSSALHLYDMRISGQTSTSTKFTSSKPQQTHHPHADYITSLTPLPPSEASTSGFSKQWVSTGDTTLAVTDLRRGVLVRSEDQEEILLSSCFVSGLPARKGGTSKGEKLIVGGGDGVLTLWEKGVWDDQDERIIVDRSAGGGESLDALKMLPDGVGPGGKVVAVGMGSGQVRFVKLGMNKVIGEIQHDEVEGVISLDFDVGGRLVTGGGSTIKVWHEKVDEDNGGYVDGKMKRSHGIDSDEDEKSDGSDDSAAEDSSDDEGDRKRRKKRKRGKGKEKTVVKDTNFAFTGMD
ncbi:hypothetical protein AAFC00_007240 [Neodothiora populina]|uniref:WD repeat-containing protein JIP5 n=1 Tax=Neodothiora populina TaxID=2781224 RepID=A0ABR3PIS2_9PEZI